MTFRETLLFYQRYVGNIPTRINRNPKGQINSTISILSPLQGNQEMGAGHAKRFVLFIEAFGLYGL
jgi:hypothetical protein